MCLLVSAFFYCTLSPPPTSSTLFPYTTLFRSQIVQGADQLRGDVVDDVPAHVLEGVGGGLAPGPGQAGDDDDVTGRLRPRRSGLLSVHEVLLPVRRWRAQGALVLEDLAGRHVAGDMESVGGRGLRRLFGS